MVVIFTIFFQCDPRACKSGGLNAMDPSKLGLHFIPMKQCKYLQSHTNAYPGIVLNKKGLSTVFFQRDPRACKFGGWNAVDISRLQNGIAIRTA